MLYRPHSRIIDAINLALTLTAFYKNGTNLFRAENLLVLVKDFLHNLAVFLTPHCKPSVLAFVSADMIVKSATVNF